MKSSTNYKKVIGGILSKYVLIFVLIITVIIMTALEPRFLSFGNFVNILLQNSYLIVATAGMVVIMISGGVDLSTSWQIVTFCSNYCSFINVVESSDMDCNNFWYGSCNFNWEH